MYAKKNMAPLVLDCFMTRGDAPAPMWTSLTLPMRSDKDAIEMARAIGKYLTFCYTCKTYALYSEVLNVGVVVVVMKTTYQFPLALFHAFLASSNLLRRPQPMWMGPSACVRLDRVGARAAATDLESLGGWAGSFVVHNVYAP